ncbi:MAG: B12-binding domain-containing radical SAM protein [Planctomycetes bacterium]|nr:B12-binding domain-containing radical SAM protein [Planctomycetota bacterium]
MADIVLVNPRFEISYWGLEMALPLMRKKANLPTACLPLLAALTPGEHTITLVDENVEDIDFDRLARADIVGVTGMSVQRMRMREILRELKARDVFTAVGGPWVTVQEDYFGDLADVIFIGEAEETWPKFLADWQQGRHQERYEQLEKTDMTRVPTPRFDLLKNEHYAFGSLQFSRGCPFQCEFCDIIVTFGRRPRLKTAPQIRRELDALLAQKMDLALIVDDNLIGNKQAIKPLLKEVADWQREHGFPFNFFTEASLDLADDEELMQGMIEANITAVFIGIESPNEASLRETKKFQNVRPGRTLVERVHAVQDAGLDVWCGMIIGFDHDDAQVFEQQRKFLEESRIIHAMVGMLAAIPKTPLHKRLAAEGRLDESDPPEYGTNIVPAQMTRAELRDGYVQLLNQIYDPTSYFDRLEELYIRAGFKLGQARRAYWRKHPLAWTAAMARFSAMAAGVFLQLMVYVPDAALRREYRRRIGRFLRARPDPELLFVYVLKCAMHYHHYFMARKMAAEEMAVVNSF